MGKRTIETKIRLENRNGIELLTGKIGITGSVAQKGAKKGEGKPVNMSILMDLSTDATVLWAAKGLMIEAQRKWKIGQMPKLTEAGAILKASEIAAKSDTAIADMQKQLSDAEIRIKLEKVRAIKMLLTFGVPVEKIAEQHPKSLIEMVQGNPKLEDQILELLNEKTETASETKMETKSEASHEDSEDEDEADEIVEEKPKKGGKK